MGEAAPARRQEADSLKGRPAGPGLTRHCTVQCTLTNELHIALYYRLYYTLLLTLHTDE